MSIKKNPAQVNKKIPLNPLPFEISVPIPESTIIRPQDYLDIIRQGVLIVKTDANAGATETVIYTVPARKKFLLIMFEFQAYAVIANLSGARLIRNSDDAQKIVRFDGTNVTGQNTFVSTALPIPMVFNSGETISSKTGANMSCSTCLVGYEISAII